MNFRILLVTVISFFVLACGAKKEKKDELQKDSLKTQYDLPENPNDSIQSKQMNVEVDSNEVNTNTEMLDENGQLDPNSSPTAVVQTIIKAAKTGKYGALLKLSNPAIDMDGDAKDIINVASSDKNHQKEFNEFFGNAKIVGQPRIKKNIAEVDIETTAEGGEKETIICENKFDKWYLKGL